MFAEKWFCRRGTGELLWNSFHLGAGFPTSVACRCEVNPNICMHEIVGFPSPKRKTNPNFQTASDMPGLFPARIISVKTVHDSEILRGTNSKGCTAKQHCDYKKCVNKYWWCQIDYGGDVTFFPYVTRVSKGPFDSRKPCTEQNLSGMVDLLGAWDPQRLGLGLKPFGLLKLLNRAYSCGSRMLLYSPVVCWKERVQITDTQAWWLGT